MVLQLGEITLTTAADRNVQHDSRVLFARTFLQQFLRIDRRAILQIEPGLDGQFPGSLCKVLRHDPSVRDEQTAKHWSILRSPARLGRYLLGGTQRRPHERRGDDVLVPNLRQDCDARDDGGDGHEPNGREVQDSRPETCLCGHVPNGQPEEHAFRHQLLHLYRSRQVDRGDEDILAKCAQTPCGPARRYEGRRVFGFRLVLEPLFVLG